MLIHVPVLDDSASKGEEPVSSDVVSDHTKLEHM